MDWGSLWASYQKQIIWSPCLGAGGGKLIRNATFCSCFMFVGRGPSSDVRRESSETPTAEMTSLDPAMLTACHLARLCSTEKQLLSEDQSFGRQTWSKTTARFGVCDLGLMSW
jgi:hypothetical protein